MIYEIRKGKKVYVSSNVKNCGYSMSTLKNMEKHGYHLYKNGRRSKNEHEMQT